MRKFALTLVVISMIMSVRAQTKNEWPEFYWKAPTIKVIDPMASLVGSMPEGRNVLSIHLTDVALYTGHVCPGIASAYIATKMALDALYPNGTPIRGRIRVAAMAPNDFLDVASYITGARSFYGRDELNRGDLAVDLSLKPEKPGEMVMVFQRKDNGKAVEVIFNKFKIIRPEQAKKVKSYIQRYLKGKSSKEEIETMSQKIQSLVKTILFLPPEGTFKLIPLENYEFPSKR